jgi:hypothetical protein
LLSIFSHRTNGGSLLTVVFGLGTKMHHFYKNNNNYRIAAATIFTLAIMATSSMAAPAAATTETGSNTTTPTTTSSFSDIELSPQPIYQEHVRDVSETLLNKTHAQLVVEGNGTLTLPNSTETIRTTSTGSGIVSIFSTFAGKEILTTEDGSENATAISYEIARSNKEEGIGKGIAIAIIHTNSTGRLAPLDGMILVGQEEIQPDGRPMITYWEWESGIPLPPATTDMQSPASPMNTTTTTDTTANSNATTATEEEGGEAIGEQQQQTTPTIPPNLLFE